MWSHYSIRELCAPSRIPCSWCWEGEQAAVSRPYPEPRSYRRSAWKHLVASHKGVEKQS